MTMTIPLGTEIGHYRIQKLLGSGAYAEVYLVRHTFLEVDRAMKVLRKDALRIDPMLYEEYKERYRVEWQLAARVQHPHLIQVYDLFTQEDALFAIVEYAPGGTLADSLAEGTIFDCDWVVEVLQDCAHGLDRLHKLGTPRIVHCFVNPKTIVFDRNGRAKITNFGRAKTSIERRNRIEFANLEDYDDLYQAPEFARGKMAPTSDVYSLGCVAFEMLTGQRVASTDVRSPRQIEPSVPKWLDQIVVRMLNDDPGFSRADIDNPGNRFVDMQHLLSVLQESWKHTDLGSLRDKVVLHFTLSELHNICYELGVNHEEISVIVGETVEFAREMLRYFQHREMMDDLIEQFHRERPNIDW